VIYLLSQIAISLVLAAIVGGAIGWLLHRAKAASHIDELQDIVDRQRQQVSEAQTEVNILSADFDDLKQVSESEINKLKNDNKQIPALNQNLEKSQLLVRQLMEQHKTELDETVEENQRLLIKSRQIDDREKEITKLQAELDIERRKSTRADTDNTASNTANAVPITNRNTDNADNRQSASLHTNPAESSQNPSSTNIANAESASASTTSHTNRLPLSANPVNASVSESLAVNDTSDSNDDTLPNTAQTQSELTEIRDQLAEDAPSTSLDRESDSSTVQERNSNFVEVGPTVSGPHKIAETEVDDTSLEQMFDTVDQHDDLKQIFGIGPVTEKTLNKLGITAYSQLAELKQHDIEKIAEALQIFPGRIERDNWVGGARAQLEEVLEDL